ncbi:ion transporter [Breznakiellaceae bacterium SP9]
MNLKKKAVTIIEESDSNKKTGGIFNYGISVLICVNVICAFLESFKTAAALLNLPFLIIDSVSVFIFSAEFLLRVWTADLKYPYSPHPRLQYIFSFMALIDICAIIPFYLLVNLDLRFLRILRLFRMMRIFKLSRHVKAMNTIGRVLKNEWSKILSTLVIIALLLLFAASAMYYCENPVQPDKFENIAATLWWAIATLTTVGYGDIYPVTVIGKVIGGIISILGVGLVALPSGIISSGFIVETNRLKKADRRKHRVHRSGIRQRKKSAHQH